MPVACRTLPQLACSPISMGFQEKGGDKSDLLDQLYPIPLCPSRPGSYRYLVLLKPVPELF